MYKPIDLKLAFYAFSDPQSLPVLLQLLFSAHGFFLLRKVFTINNYPWPEFRCPIIAQLIMTFKTV